MSIKTISITSTDMVGEGVFVGRQNRSGILFKLLRDTFVKTNIC